MNLRRLVLGIVLLELLVLGGIASVTQDQSAPRLVVGSAEGSR